VHKLSELTLPERVYAIICDVPAAELPDDDQLIPQLRALLLASEQWPMALEAHRRVHPAAAHGLTFAVKAERHGRRFKAAVSSLALGRALGGALHTHFGWRVDLSQPMLEVTAALNDDAFFVSIALLRRLDSIECRTAGGLHPHVAWAMVRSVGGLPPGALVCDPMCGKGRVLLEALDAHATCVAIGLDSDGEQLARAAANRDAVAQSIGSRMVLLHGDASALPFERCDAIVCDLPFEGDTKFGHHLDTSRGASLRRVVREWARVLPVSGRAVALISEARLPVLHEALVGSGLRAIHQRACPLGFTRAAIVVTERVDAAAAAADDDDDDAGDDDADDRCDRDDHHHRGATDAPWSQADEHEGPTEEGSHARMQLESRLPWEGSGRRSSWGVLKKQDRGPMVPWWRPESTDGHAHGGGDANTNGAPS
jgi:SAM-dependent methyltransferase